MNTSYKRNRISICALTVLLSLAAAPTYAQEGTAETPIVTPQTATTKREDARTNLRKTRSNIQNNRMEQKQDIQEKIDAHKEDVREKMQERASNTKERVENRKARLKDTIQARIRAHAARMFARFTAAIERHEELARRIESRIVKLEAQGRVEAEARRFLGEAAGFLNEATIFLTQAKTAFENAARSENPKEAFVAASETLRQAHEKITSAHASLIHAVRELRQNKPDINQ